MAAGSAVTEHHILTGTKTVKLEADSRFRILLFTEADCMLSMETLLFSLEADSLAVIPPNAETELKFGTYCRYWQLAFHAEPSIPLLRQMYYRWSSVVHLSGEDKSLHLFFPQLRKLDESRLNGDEDSILCYEMAFGTLLYGSAACLSRDIRFEPEQRESVASRVRDYIDANFVRQISLETLENVFFVSRHHICRCFSAVYGKTVMEYLRSLRTEKACDLLLNTNMPISDISRNCGFNTVQSFHSVFSRITGSTPLQYRKSGSSK